MFSESNLPRRPVLYVKVIRAHKLKAADPNGKSDPYCSISLDGFGSEFQTKVCPATLEPEWNQAFSFLVADPQSIALGYEDEVAFAAYLRIDVWDHDRFNAADHLGRVIVPLCTVSETMKEVRLPLGRSSAKEQVSGEIVLALQFSYRQDKVEMSSPSPASVADQTSVAPVNFSLPRAPIDMRKERAAELNTYLYELTVDLGYHLPILCGKLEEKLPGRTEKVDFCVSNVIVQMGSAKCIAQVYVTNYRLVIVALPEKGNWLRYEQTQDLTTYIPLSAIKSIEKGQDEKIIQRFSEGSKHTESVSITVHCHDVRKVKLIFIHGTNPTSSRQVANFREKNEVEIPFEPLDSISECSFDLDTSVGQPLMASHNRLSAQSSTETDSMSMTAVLRKPPRSRSCVISASDSKPNKQSFSSASNILVDEVSRLEMEEEGDDFLIITREFGMTGAMKAPVNITDGSSSSVSTDMKTDKKSRSFSSNAVSYNKMAEAGTDAVYNTGIDKVLVRAGAKFMSAADLHQRLANALFLKLEYHILNQPEQTSAFLYAADNPHVHFGFWDLYNFPREMGRQEIPDMWYLSAVNGPQYRICSTYPALLYFPAHTPKDVIEASAEFRSRGRLPALVWISKRNRCWMMRSAQPLTGANYKRSQEDESLLEHALSLAPANSDMVIFDARSFIAAGGNRFKGKGTEVPTNYKRSRLVYLDIPNIHAVRDSGDKLLEACLSAENVKWLSLVESTSWLNYISVILKGSNLITNYMTERNCCALVHCSDGWDRTAQLCSLSQIMMDPFYRTIEGFIILIEKEWISFGHKFRHRLGHPNHPNERSPVFLQFLDCVYQILSQVPTEFEFTSKLLLRIAELLHSEWFGTFITDSELLKNDIGIMAQTVSLWAHIMAVSKEWLSPAYKPNPDQEVIKVEHNIRRLHLWQEFFLRYDITSAQHSADSEEVKDFEDRERLLSHSQDMVVWVADSKATECKGCGQKFSVIMRRKHHCRACGYIFCNDCTKSRMPLPQFGYDEDVRVCDRCFKKGNEQMGGEIKDSE